MDIFNTFATDDSLETNGVWQKLGDAEFLIARANNRAYARMLGRAVEQNSMVLDGENDESAKLSESVMAEVFAKTILLDWKNVSYQGKPFPYSEENARKALQHRDFRREIARLSEGIEAYRAKVEEKQAKN
jgi:hypothetical protein